MKQQTINVTPMFKRFLNNLPAGMTTYKNVDGVLTMIITWNKYEFHIKEVNNV